MNVYSLINENNVRFSLSNFRETTLIPSLNGIGYEHNSEYVRVGNSYRLTSREIKQGQLSGKIQFKKYSMYLNLIEYIERSENLRLIYKPINTEYYRDVNFNGITGVVVKGNLTECDIVFNCTSLYYTEDNRRFVIERIEGESRYNLPFPFTFNDYSGLAINYNNQGHVEGELLAEIFGYIINPVIELYVNGRLKSRVMFDITVEEGQKLLYSTKDGDNYVALEDTDGTQSNIPNCLKLTNNNFFKIPKGQSILKITSDSGVLNKAVFRILTAYKGV